MDDHRNVDLGLERIVFFSDAVMAIAITLLAIDLRAPDLAGDVAAQQWPQALAAWGPKITSFVISFVIIGVYWLSHHRYFEYVRCYDNRFSLINLGFLFLVAVLPASTSLLGAYPGVSLAVAAYAANVAALGLIAAALWRYAAYGHRLVDPDLDQAFIRTNLRSGLFAPAIFLVSIPVAYVNPRAALFVWWLSPLPLLVLFISRRLARRAG